MRRQDIERHQTENGYGSGEEADQVDQENLDSKQAAVIAV